MFIASKILRRKQVFVHITEVGKAIEEGFSRTLVLKDNSLNWSTGHHVTSHSRGSFLSSVTGGEPAVDILENPLYNSSALSNIVG